MTQRSDPWRFAWKPALYVPGWSGDDKFFPLPQPIVQLDPVWPFRKEQHEGPKVVGGKAFGLSQQPTVITLTGVICEGSTGRMITEEEMFGAFQDILERVQTQSDLNHLEFFYYYDNEGSDTVYVKHKDVVVDSLQISVGDQTRPFFGYQMSLTALDPKLYSTSPGN